MLSYFVGDENARGKKVQIFQNFLQKENISEETVWSFHHQKPMIWKTESPSKGKTPYKTISTTQVIISDEIILKHQDRLNTHSKPEKSFEKMNLKLRFHKIVHWEYWSVYSIYMPLLPVWLYCAFKARTLCFSMEQNPSIKYGGMAMEKKKKKFDLIPENWIPKNLFSLHQKII